MKPRELMKDLTHAVETNTDGMVTHIQGEQKTIETADETKTKIAAVSLSLDASPGYLPRLHCDWLPLVRTVSGLETITWSQTVLLSPPVTTVITLVKSFENSPS